MFKDTKEINSLLKEWKKFATERELIDKKLVQISKKIEHLRKDIVKDFKFEGISIPDFLTIIKHPIWSHILYTKIESYFYKTWYEKGLYRAGDQIHIRLSRKKDLEGQFGALDFAPYVDNFQIFEHALCENGIYFLKKENDKWVLCLMRYHRESKEKEFTDIEKALKYIYEHHPYEYKNQDTWY